MMDAYVLVLCCILHLNGVSKAISLSMKPWLHAITVDDDSYTKDTVTDYRDNVTCPSSRPLEWHNGTKTICVASCGKNMVVDGSKCINVTECTKAVLSDGVCMDLCPEGYIYELFEDHGNGCGDEYDPCHYTQNDIENKPCVKRSCIIGRVIFLTIATLVYIVGVWFFFSTRRFCQCLKQKKWFKFMSRKNSSADNELLINGDEEE